ncbi:winged helix-turn-helix domain-containing protein [Kitasatospora sp. NPDC089913]|uniref:winged helix-turn-helix domain-containing protein n=1 Tax=Kitasatospora sp. NPDC089913 TaxID=3364080 RepID=UPI00382CBB86
MGKYLRRWGLPFQRPDRPAVEQDPEAVRGWLEETWPAIRAKAKAESAEVLVTHIDHSIGSTAPRSSGRMPD